MKFTHMQMKAIQHKDGPMMVIAGPGSGKTAVLTNRIINLCKRGIKPENILVITFTKAAATEMEKRCIKLSDEIQINCKGVMFGTFHSVFFYLLKKYGHFPKLTFADFEIKKKYMSEALTIFGMYSVLSNQIITMINEAERYKVSDEKPTDSYSKVFEYYFELLHDNGFLDFEDMLIHFVKMLKAEPKLCYFLQEKYRYILLDEFQDINSVQYEAIRLLSSERHNVFAVGDEDQSIYGFRGSDPSIMKRFIKDFASTSVIKLEDNFRSISDIVEVGNDYIAKNKNRFDKRMHSALCKSDSKDNVVSNVFKTNEDEQKYILNRIEMLISQKTDPSQIAILYRNNIDVKKMGDYLQNNGVRQSIKNKESERDKYEFIEEMQAFLNLALMTGNNEKQMGRKQLCESLLSINNVSILKLPRSVFLSEDLSIEEITNLLFKSYSSQASEGFGRFMAKICILKSLSGRAGMKYIENVLGYSKELETKNEKKKLFEDLFNSLSFDDELIDVMENLNSERHKASRYTHKESLDRNNADSINIMTIHQAKGLEFDVVFLASLMEFGKDNEYSFSGHEQQDVEEERRIIYVGITRARKKLFMSYVK